MRVAVPWRRMVRAIVPVTVVSLILGIAVVAVLADGFPTKDVDLHDGGVWVTKGDDALAGRFIVPIEELDAAVAVNATAVSELDLLQEERQVFLSTGAGLLRRIDVAEVSLPEGGARIPALAGIALGGGVVAVLDPADGRLWVRPATTVDGLDTTTTTEDATVGGDAAVTVGRDGTVHAVSGDTDRVLTVRRGADGVQVQTADLGVDVRNPSITAVGARAVVLSEGGRVVLPGAGERVLPGAPRQVRLQQPGPASDVVAVATEDRLYGVPLGDGDLAVLSADGTGGPAAPVQLGGCFYAAWSVRPLMARVCPGGAPIAPVRLDTVALANDQLEFRVNYDLIVLNQVGSGAIFTFDRVGENLGNWEQIKPPKLDDDPSATPDSQIPPPPDQNTPPVAKDDPDYGARPGQATLLPVLENDGDIDGDFLVINTVSAVGNGARVNVVANGQALQLVLPPGARGIVTFRYVISDGRGGEDDAEVTVTVRDPAQNFQPTQIDNPRVALVELGGTVNFHVLTDWRDKDGDPLVLMSATTEGPDLVRSTPDGFLTFVDGNVSPGSKTVDVLIADGHGDPVAGTVTVEVLRRGEESPPDLRDDRVVGFTNRPLIIQPLLNDTDANITAPGSAGGLRLFEVSPAAVGASRTPNLVDGTIVFTATEARTYYLTYRALQGSGDPEEARIRVDILNDSARNAPVAVADTVILRGTSAGVVDVLANDTDADGDVLVISSVEVPENSGLIVSVLEHRWLRVIAPSTLDAIEPIRYTVSDGFASDVGVVAVSRLTVSEDQPPSARDDEAFVRAGDVVAIDVLANDVDPEGGLLTLDPTITPANATRGQWYVTGDTVRFHAPGTTGTATAYYTVVDPGGLEHSGTITVTIKDTAENQKPQPEPLEARVFAGAVTRIFVPLSGVDPDGDSVVLVHPTNAPEHGRIIGRGIDYLEYEAYQGAGGTDEFQYLVRDPFGLEATGTVRVGIIPRPAEDSAPVAIDDYYEVAPGATVNAPVLANDSDVDGDALQLEALTVPNPAIGERAVVAGNRIVVVAPTIAGQSVSVQYAVTDGRGLRSFATLLVVAMDGANQPPTAEDDWVHHFPAGATTVDVPVLDNDDDVDGSRNDLQVQPIPDDSGLAVTWDGPTHRLRIELGDRPRQVAYRVTDAGGATAHAFVHVPAKGNQAPYVRDDVEDITITAGTDLAIGLQNYVEDAEGEPLLITEVAKVFSSPQPGVTVAENSVGPTTLTLHADAAYAGPATLVVEVTDGTRLVGRRSSITLDVTVTPAGGRFPQVACPPVHPRAGAPAILLDLRTCVLGLTPQQRDALSFSDPDGAPDGVNVERDGVQLRLSAGRDVPPGTSGVLRFAIGGPWGDIDAEMTVLVLEASLPRANTDEILLAKAGQEQTFDVTANDNNPFPETPLRVTGVTVEAGEVTASVDSDQRTVRVRPADGYHGVATIVYTVRDALDVPEREASGRLIVHVVARPEKPSPPRQVSVAANRAVISFIAPDPKGAPIDGYQVKDQDGTITECGTSTICEVTGLDNGVGYRFQVQAHNIVDWSDWSDPSPTITPDQRPDQPAAPTTEFGDGQITVHWTPPNSEGTDIVEYRIEQSPGGITVVGGDARSHPFLNLTNGASYTYRIQAVNGAPEPSDWSPWSAPEVPAGPPAAPAAPTAAGVADGIGEQMTVQWSAPNDNGAPITSYTLTIIRINTPTGTQTLAGDITSTTVDVENGVQYLFQVTATNKAGESPSSPTSAPAVAHGRPDQITSFTVAEADASNHGFDARVQYSLVPPDDNGMAISRYEFDYTGEGTSDYSGAASGYVTGLTNGTSYQIRVRACNDLCGTWSAASNTVNPFGRPLMPAATASAAGQTQLNFSWSVPAANGRAIDRLEWRLPGHAQYDAWQVVDPAAGGSQSWTGLGPGTQREVQVRVFDVTGWDSPVRVASATTDNPPAAMVTVWRRALRPPDATCDDPSCGYIGVRLENFSPNTTYSITFWGSDNGGGNFGSTVSATTNGSGTVQVNTSVYYGYQGATVRATVNPGGVVGTMIWPP